MTAAGSAGGVGPALTGIAGTSLGGISFSRTNGVRAGSARAGIACIGGGGESLLRSGGRAGLSLHQLWS
jgi:hypothetical protein